MGSMAEGSAPGSNDTASGSSNAASRNDGTKSSRNDLLTNLKIHFVPQCSQEWNGETSNGTWKCVYCGVKLRVIDAETWHESFARKHYNKHCKDKLQSTIDKLTAKKDKLISRLASTPNKLNAEEEKLIPRLQATIDKLTDEKDNMKPQLPSIADTLTDTIRKFRRINCRLQQDIQCLTGQDWRLCWCNEGEARRVNCPFGHVREGDNGEHLWTMGNMQLQMDAPDDDGLLHRMESCDCLYAPLTFPLPPTQETRPISGVLKNALEKTIKQLESEYTLLTANKKRLLHQPTDTTLSGDLLFLRLQRAQSYLSDMKRGIQVYAAGHGLQVNYSRPDAVGNFVDSHQLRKKLSECLNEIGSYAEIFHQQRASITDAMFLPGWSLLVPDVSETPLVSAFNDVKMDSTSQYQPSTEIATACLDNNDAASYSNLQEMLLDPNYLAILEEIDLADLLFTLHGKLWGKEHNVLSQRSAIMIGGEDALVKNESASRKIPTMEDDTRKMDESLGGLEDAESKQDALTDALRTMSLAHAKDDANFTGTYQESYVSTDARQRLIATVPRGPTDRNIDTRFTGVLGQDASFYKHSSEPNISHSCRPAIDGSSSAALKISLGTGSGGPSVDVIGSGDARNRGPIIDQSSDDCRRKIEEWKAETTSSKRKDTKEKKPKEEKSSPDQPAEQDRESVPFQTDSF